MWSIGATRCKGPFKWGEQFERGWPSLEKGRVVVVLASGPDLSVLRGGGGDAVLRLKI